MAALLEVDAIRATSSRLVAAEPFPASRTHVLVSDTRDR